MTFRTLRNATLSLTAAAALTLSAVSARAQDAGQKADRDQQSISDAESSAPHNWTSDQIITATVHQAWILSGKDETNFFEIIKELAEISAHNRNMMLPNDPAAGRRAGAYIKAQAKADHNQLLYAIVDKSVQMTGTKAPETGN
jgi:hypothetical protein